MVGKTKANRATSITASLHTTESLSTTPIDNFKAVLKSLNTSIL